MLERMFFAAGFAASIALAQDVGTASKSPIELERYVESHAVVDWNQLLTALGLQEPKYWARPCGARGDDPCSAQVVTVLNPDQQIVIIHGDLLAVRDVYLRYMRQGDGWRLAAAYWPYVKNYPRRYEIFRFNNKPFLKISSDHSQIGFSLLQEVEDWFDLTQPGFDPVFSFTAAGSLRPFCFAIGRTITAHTLATTRSGIETIDLFLDVHYFVGAGNDTPATYVGTYTRPSGDKRFSLRSAYSGYTRKDPIPLKDFEGLGVDIGEMPNDRLLVYALPELQRIASGSNADAKECLQQILKETGDTPERRTLSDLLAKH